MWGFWVKVTLRGLTMKHSRFKARLRARHDLLPSHGSRKSRNQKFWAELLGLVAIAALGLAFAAMFTLAI